MPNAASVTGVMRVSRACATRATNRTTAQSSTPVSPNMNGGDLAPAFDYVDSVDDGGQHTPDESFVGTREGYPSRTIRIHPRT
jgi:hypothetical protein